MHGRPHQEIKAWFGWLVVGDWWLVLIYCERKILLVDE
jgi:hypothetical protein